MDREYNSKQRWRSTTHIRLSLPCPIVCEVWTLIADDVDHSYDIDLLNSAAIYRLNQRKQLQILPKHSQSKLNHPSTQLNSPVSHVSSHSRSHSHQRPQKGPPPSASHSPQQAIAQASSHPLDSLQEEAGAYDHGPAPTVSLYFILIYRHL